MQLVTYSSHGHHWNVTSFENPEKKACPHPEEQSHLYMSVLRLRKSHVV